MFCIYTWSLLHLTLISRLEVETLNKMENLQNIGAANSDDVFYRYKMPKMITKIEGRGNGIKTNVVNMVDIAKPWKGLPLTRQSSSAVSSVPSPSLMRKLVSHSSMGLMTAKLAGLLENFIKFVQCYGCGNPKTEIIMTKTQIVNLKCAACGFVSDVDMRDKFTTYILKNLPEQQKGSKDKKVMRRAEKERIKAGEAADEEQKLKKDPKKKGIVLSKEAANSKVAVTKKKASGSDEEHSSLTDRQADENEVPDDDDDVQWQTDTSLEAARQHIQEQLSAATAKMVMLSTTAEPKTEEKPKQEKIAETASNDTTDEPEKLNPHDKLAAEIKDHLNKGLKPSQLGSFVTSLTASHQEAMNALIMALFEGVGKGFAKKVGKKKTYLADAVQDEGSQITLFWAIEAFCGNCNGDAVKEVALVAKCLYDGDVLEEECIVQWYKEGLAGANKCSQIWKNMKPFIEWLQSAESESEEE